MNSPKMPVLNNLNDASQRGDFSGQVPEAADNAEEIRAIEKTRRSSPTQPAFMSKVKFMRL